MSEKFMFGASQENNSSPAEEKSPAPPKNPEPSDKNITTSLMAPETREDLAGIEIPKGWTILKHGTNLSVWGEINPRNSDIIVLTKNMSVITKEDAEYDKSVGLDSTTEGYAGKNGIEIDVLFYDDPRIGKNKELQKSLNPELQNRIAQYYFKNEQSGRHPLVPNGTTLIKIGESLGVSGKMDAFYFVPQGAEEDYKAATEAKRKIKNGFASTSEQDKEK